MIVHDTEDDPALRVAAASIYSPNRRTAAAEAAGVGYEAVGRRAAERAHTSWAEEESPTAASRGLSFSRWQTGEGPRSPNPAASAGSATPRSPSLLGMESKSASLRGGDAKRAFSIPEVAANCATAMWGAWGPFVVCS